VQVAERRSAGRAGSRVAAAGNERRGTGTD
jgi:hypothetical protein